MTNRAGVVIGVLCVAMTSAARGDVDMTGRWDLSTDSGPLCIVMAQSGTSLTGQGCELNGYDAAGTVNPSTGEFTLTEPDDISICPPPPFTGCYPCGHSLFTGTATPDGYSLSGTLVLSVPSFTSPNFCAEASFAVVGTKSVCGDGVVQPDERCDDGNTADGDCCSSLCQYEAAPCPGVCGDGVVSLGERCDDGNTADGDCCSSLCQYEAAPCPGACGDGVLSLGEQCDDGNVTAGDCCSSLCQYEAAGSPCPDDGSLCTVDECDGSGTCVSAPPTGCRPAGESSLAIRVQPEKRWTWNWRKGPQTTQGDFGDPRADTDYALCLFTGAAPAALAEVNIPADAMKWKAISTVGYKYRDQSASADGVTRVVLKGGGAGMARIMLKAKGPNLPAVSLGALSPPLTARLIGSAGATCFEAAYDSADVAANDGSHFKVKAK